MEYYSAFRSNDFMKLSGKWEELETIILSEVIQSQKNSCGMQSLIIGYSPQKALNTKKQFTDLMKLKKKEGQNVDASVLLRRENKTLRGGNTRSNRGNRD